MVRRMKLPVMCVALGLVAAGCNQEHNHSIEVMNKGVEEGRQKLFDSAIRDLKAATTIDPSNAAAYYNLGTIGKGGGGGNGSGYGRGAGGLGGRRAHAPDVVPGTAQVRGSLDKEIIRRIIRRHLNEVRFCYEKELMHKQDLYGRVMIQFTISGTGQVVASVVQNSTMNKPNVEQCIAQAVRRWEFPKPQGGGIVIVSYPFVLKAAGAE